jgi:hypothetical protein
VLPVAKAVNAAGNRSGEKWENLMGGVCCGGRTEVKHLACFSGSSVQFCETSKCLFELLDFVVLFFLSSHHMGLLKKESILLGQFGSLTLIIMLIILVVC